MRTAEKFAAVLIIAVSVWAIVMMAATNWQFKGSQRDRILLVELGSDAPSLQTAVQTGLRNDVEGVAQNIRLVVRNTYMDFLFIALYWLTFVSLSYLAGILGHRLLAALAAISISVAAVADVLENHAILIAMGVRNFTDSVAVDISEFSQVKWAFFFLAMLLLGFAIVLNRHTSKFRRVTGAIFLAAGASGLLGIGRSRVSLDFALVMINVGMLLVTAALLLTLWKLVQSVRTLEQVAQASHQHVSA